MDFQPGSWRRPPAVQEQVAVDLVDVPLVEGEGIGDVGDAAAGDGGFGFVAPDQARGQKDVDFIDGAGIEKAAQDIGAALDQDVGPAAAAQLGEQGVDIGPTGAAGNGQDLTA